MRATCLTAPDDGVQPALLVSIPTNRQRSLGHAAPAQYLFNVPEGFSRLVLEHRVRPSAGLRAVCALSSHPEALGGWGGLLMRLKQDGHGRVEVVGPSGLGRELVQFGTFVKWRHPQVFVHEVTGSEPRLGQPVDTGAPALSVPAGCCLHEPVQPVPAECCYQDELVSIMALLPNQQLTALPDWLTGASTPIANTKAAATSDARHDDKSSSSSESSSSESSDSESSSSKSSTRDDGGRSKPKVEAGCTKQDKQQRPSAAVPPECPVKPSVAETTSSSSDGSSSSSSSDDDDTSDSSTGSSSDDDSDHSDGKQQAGDRFDALDALFLASHEKHHQRAPLHAGRGMTGRGWHSVPTGRGRPVNAGRHQAQGRGRHQGSVLQDPSRQQLLQALTGAVQSGKPASSGAGNPGTTKPGQASKSSEAQIKLKQGQDLSGHMCSDVPLLGYLCLERATGQVLVVLCVPHLAALQAAQRHSVLVALTERPELQSRVVAIAHFSPSHVTGMAQYQHWLMQLPGRQALFNQQGQTVNTTAAMTTPAAAPPGTSTAVNSTTPVPGAAVCDPAPPASGSKQLGFHASTRVLCRLQLLSRDVFPLPASLSHLITPDLAALPSPRLGVQSSAAQQADERYDPGPMETAEALGVGSDTGPCTSHRLGTPRDGPEADTSVPEADRCTATPEKAETDLYASHNPVAAPSQAVAAHQAEQPVEVQGHVVHAQLLWQLCNTASTPASAVSSLSPREGGEDGSDGSSRVVCKVLAPVAQATLDVEGVWKEMLSGDHGVQLVTMLQDLKISLAALHSNWKQCQPDTTHAQGAGLRHVPGSQPYQARNPDHTLHLPPYHTGPPPLQAPPVWPPHHPSAHHHHAHPPPYPPARHLHPQSLPHTAPGPWQHPHPAPPAHHFPHQYGSPAHPHAPPPMHPYGWSQPPPLAHIQGGPPAHPGSWHPRHQQGPWPVGGHGPAHGHVQGSWGQHVQQAPHGHPAPPQYPPSHPSHPTPPPEKRPRIEVAPGAAAAQTGLPAASSTTSNQVAAERLRHQLRGGLPRPPSVLGTTPATSETVQHQAGATSSQVPDSGIAPVACTPQPVTQPSAVGDDARMSQDGWCSSWLADAPACVRSPRAAHTRVIFLGTGSAEPSKYRGPSAILVQLNEQLDSVLLDCGEGTWGALVRCLGEQAARRQVAALRCLWCSHKHADHCLGLPGLLAARPKHAPPLLVAGPHDLKPWLQHLNDNHGYKTHFIHCRQFSSRPQDWGYAHPGQVPLQEALLGCGPQGLGLVSWCSVAVHHCSDAYGVVLQHRDGWKLVYSGDTRPCPALAQAGAGATLLIHEATFEQALLQQALNKRHSTSIEALEMGHRMQAYRTILTHFSQRYPRVPAGLGLTEDSEDEEDREATCVHNHAAEGPEVLGTSHDADADNGDDCCGGHEAENQQGRDLAQPMATSVVEGAPRTPRLPPVASDIAVRSSAIAFDGMIVRLSDIPWLPLLGPYMDRVLKRPETAAEQ